MELPKLVYEDLYKFTMSLGAILFLVSGAGIFISIGSIFMLLPVAVFISSIFIMWWAWGKWYINQKLLDRQLGAQTTLIEQEAGQLIVPDKPIFGPEFSRECIEKEAEKDSSVALVSCKIASVLPNSVTFNFLKQFKVWFWIANHEPKRYLAYVKIKFIIDNFKEESESDYYGGLKAWKLNAYSGIQAPGLGFSEKVKNAVRQGKKIKIEINCKIHDEFNKLVEEKLPQTYVYKPENNSWFLEP